MEPIYEVMKLQHHKTNDKRALRPLYRRVLEPYVYMYLTENYGPMLHDFWKTYLPPKQADKAYVIVERRMHPNFRFVLHNMAWAAPHMSVYLFCSDENKAFIEAILGDKVDSFHVIPIFKGEGSLEDGVKGYNDTLTSYAFYESIAATYILTIQMDVILRKKIPDNMFIYDYWGAPWGWRQDVAGGGGATIRRVEAMIALCKQYRPDLSISIQGDEDTWFSDRVVTGPFIEFRRMHIMENMVAIDPIILHQFWSYAEGYLENFTKEIIIDYWKHLLTISEEPSGFDISLI